MNNLQFDYTKETNKDTLCGAGLTQYRLVHWMVDILRNFMSDPVNMHDERLVRLLFGQDGKIPETLDALFRIEPPYTRDVRKAGTTPAIMVSAGDETFPVGFVNIPPAVLPSTSGAAAAFSGHKIKQATLNIAVITESCDGTILLKDIIETFLVMHEQLLVWDNGSISEFHVTGASQVQAIQAGQAANAKPLYQQVLSVQVVGGLRWNVDTQGSVFNGMRGTLRAE